MKNPCKPDCQRRSVSCHGECQEYLAFRAECEERYNARLLYAEAKDYTRHTIEKKKHRLNRKTKV
jgi:hypothetical protein